MMKVPLIFLSLILLGLLGLSQFGGAKNNPGAGQWREHGFEIGRFERLGFTCEPGYAREGFGVLMLWLKGDGTWGGWQTDHYNDYGCSWGADSGVISGTWIQNKGKWLLSDDGEYRPSQMRPLVAIRSVELLPWKDGVRIIDADGKVLDFEPRD
jgi:hypothetical protein